MICTETAPAVIELAFKENTISVQTTSSIGEYAETLTADSVISSPVHISFNASYLVDCLKSYKCDNLELAFGDALRPMVIDDGRLRSMVLPLRLEKKA